VEAEYFCAGIPRGYRMGSTAKKRDSPRIIIDEENI
jgi:hypothetical protein